MSQGLLQILCATQYLPRPYDVCQLCDYDDFSSFYKGLRS